MIKQIILSIKNFKRTPLLFFISIPGLVIGITAAVLLIAFIQYETSFDKFFPNKNRVVRLYNIWIEDNSVDAFPICLRKAYTEIPNQIPEIEKAVQIYRGGKTNVHFNKNQFNSKKLLYVDSEFFDVFGLSLLQGDKTNALTQKYMVVLTESLAKKIFNKTDCLGKNIKIGNDNYTITGVIKDFPKNSHINFDLLASLSTFDLSIFQGLEFFTYYLLNKDADFKSADSKISALNNKLLDGKFGQFNAKFKSGTEKLLDIHLHSITDFDLSDKGDKKQIFILSFIVFFILLIAVVNYINLFVLYGEKRAGEIGIKKTFGASRSDIIKIIYFDAVLVNLIAFALTFILIAIAIAFINSYNIDVNIDFIKTVNLFKITVFTVFFIVLVIITGAYPALYLSKLKPVDIIKGKNYSVKRKKWLSVLSVIIQFSISVFLITNLLIINYQIKHLKNIPLGFNVKNVIGINISDNNLSGKVKSIKEELKKLPYVSSVGSSSHFMGGGCSGQLIYPYGESEKNGKSINQYRVQEGFCKTMQLQLSAGRFFNGTNDDKSSIILNEAAVKKLGLKNPVGKLMVMDVDPLKIIGVTKNFYYNNYAGEDIAPLVLSYGYGTNVIYLRIDGNITKQKLKQIDVVFSSFNSNNKFDFFSLQDIYKNKFSDMNKLMTMLLLSTLLALFLSFTGMFALSVFNVEARTKEIGIRKVLGSSSLQIVVKLIKDTLKWVVISMPLAFIISGLIMSRWLETFANRIDIGIWFFIEAGVIAVIIAIGAVSIKSIITAMSNPVEALRYE